MPDTGHATPELRAAWSTRSHDGACHRNVTAHYRAWSMGCVKTPPRRSMSYPLTGRPPPRSTPSHGTRPANRALSLPTECWYARAAHRVMACPTATAAQRSCGKHSTATRPRSAQSAAKGTRRDQAARAASSVWRSRSGETRSTRGAAAWVPTTPRTAVRSGRASCMRGLK